MKRILVGFDGSETSRRALQQACALGALAGGSVTVLTAAADQLVREDGIVTPALDEELAARTAAAGAELARACGAADASARVSVDAPAEALLETSREGFDLVVVGHRGIGGLEELFAGSTARTLVDRCGCPVLVVP